MVLQARGDEGPVQAARRAARLLLLRLQHALDWLEYRHSSVEANKLLRMLPAERAKALGGRTIEEVLVASAQRF